MTGPRRERRRRRIASWLLCGMLLAPLPAAAQALPKLTEPVTDLGHVIDPASAAELDRRIRALHTASGDVVAVLTVPTIAPYSTIEEYAVRAFEQSGIGARTKDNGALIVLAVAERRVRIEVGYGLEEFVPDGFAGDTIRQVMLPAFRQGQYGPGLLDGTTRVIQRIAAARQVTLTDVPSEPASRGEGMSGPSLFQIILFVIVLMAIISSIRRGGGGPPLRRRGGWPMQPWGGAGWYGGLGGFGGGFGGGHRGGGGIGGFGGFGGGRSGGGGASGGW